MAHYYAIACKALKPEIEFCLTKQPSQNSLTVDWMQQGLHNTPEELRTQLQKKLDTVPDADAVLLAYGLCGGALRGLHCRRTLVIPRAHDCISLLFGSRETHEQYVREYPGSYFFSAGWLREAPVPSAQNDRRRLEEYTALYGPDNADYLLQTETAWRKKYKQAVYISWNLPDSPQDRRMVQDCAAYLGWNYTEIQGSPDWLCRLLNGPWNPEDFLVLNPNQPVPEDLSGLCLRETQP
ncbi:MAG: DUF1638 domain-containing protein [Anaerohalosphaeraceae bacterium]